jgi:sentrin-specific protease 1
MYRQPKDKKDVAIRRLAVTLDESEMNRVEYWLNGHSREGPTEHIGSIGDAILTQGKFAALRDGHLLNDEIINASLHMYNSMHCGGAEKPSHVFSSFFYARLAEERGGYCYENVRRWTKWISAKRKIPHMEVKGVQGEQACSYLDVEGRRWLNLFQYDKVYIPINIMNFHWFLIVLVMDKKKVVIIDSVGGDKSKYFDNICRWLKDEGAKVNVPAEKHDGWGLETVSFPLQGNGSDCGVFTIAAAEMYMLDLPLLYDQGMMPNLRFRIAHELIDECLK